MLGTIKAKQNFNRKIRKKNSLSLNHHQLPGRVAIPSLLNGLSVSPVSQSCPTLVTRWTVAHQAPLCMEFSRLVYWSGLPFPTPEGLPNPGTEPTSPVTPALAGGCFTTVPGLLHSFQFYPSPTHSSFSRQNNLLKQI